MSLITMLPAMSLFICIVNLLCHCGVVERNPGIKYQF